MALAHVYTCRWPDAFVMRIYVQTGSLSSHSWIWRCDEKGCGHCLNPRVSCYQRCCHETRHILVSSMSLFCGFLMSFGALHRCHLWTRRPSWASWRRSWRGCSRRWWGWTFQHLSGAPTTLLPGCCRQLEHRHSRARLLHNNTQHISWASISAVDVGH